MKQNEFGAFILSETKNGERIVSCGGRISTRQGTAVEIYKKSIDKTKNLNLISKVISSGHTTILEHHYFNIAFNKVSVFVEQFLIEFRLASFTIKSGRYVNFSKSGFNLSDEFSDEQKTVLSRHYRDMLRTYNELVQKGVPIEDARFVLPYGIKTNIYMSVNARELVHIICSMIYGDGSNYLEIKKLGLMLKIEMDKRYPGLIDSNAKKYEIEKLGTFKLDKNLLKNYSDKIEYVSQKVQFWNEKIENCYQKLQSMAKFMEIESFDGVTSLYGKTEKLLEHIDFTFKVENFSIISLKHFTRHRMQSLSTKPLAQIALSNKFVIPNTILENEELTTIFKNAIKKNREVFEKLIGMNIDKNLLVYVMPHGIATNFISTMNVRELLHFVNLRSCNRAQWEIRNLATTMTKMLKNVDSKLFENFGPSCVTTGKCPEGRLCCGRQVEMKDKFEKLQNS